MHRYLDHRRVLCDLISLEKYSSGDSGVKMASVSLCATRISPSQLVIGTHRLMHRVSLLPFNLRLRNIVRLQTRESLFTVLASNSNPSGGDPLQETSDGEKTTDAGQSPPFLTILAGFVVFVSVCWILGSIVMWVIGLFAQLLISK